jgi:hypothetical protein
VQPLHCCSGKTINIAYSECEFVALVTQHTMNMRHIVICGLSSCTIFLHIISQKVKFSEKRLLNIKCVLIFSTNLSETLHIARIIQGDAIIIICRSAGKVPAILVRCYEIEFSRQFRKILRYQLAYKSPL